jgi:hypothetical protein
MVRFAFCVLFLLSIQSQIYGQSLIVPEWKKLIDEGYAEAPSRDYIVILLHLGIVQSIDTQLVHVERILESDVFKASADENKVIVKVAKYHNQSTKSIFINDRTYPARWPSWIAYDRFYQPMGIESGVGTSPSGFVQYLKFIRNQVKINQYLTENMEKSIQKLDSTELNRIAEDYFRRQLPVPEVFVKQLVDMVPINSALNNQQIRYLIKLAPALDNYRFSEIFAANSEFSRIFSDEMSLDERIRVNQDKIRKTTQAALNSNNLFLAKITADFLKATYGDDVNAENYRNKYLMEFAVFTENIDLLMENLVPYSEAVYFDKNIDTLKANYQKNLRDFNARTPTSSLVIPVSQRSSVFGQGSYAFYWAEHILELSKSDQIDYLEFAIKLTDFSISISEEGFNLDLKSKILNKMGKIQEAKSFASMAVKRAKETDDPHLGKFEAWLQSL